MSVQHPSLAVRLAEELDLHLVQGAWAHDDAELRQLSAQAGFRGAPWPTQVTASQAEYVKALLAKASDSDWSWEVSSLTGHQPAEFKAALLSLDGGVEPQTGLREPEAAFDHEDEEPISPHDPRAEALARARGMPEDLIAMIKEGLEDSRAGRFSPSSEVFARLAQRYGR